MIALTFPQFRDEVALQWVRQGYDFDESDLDATATNQRWHAENLVPFAEMGGEFPVHVCRSIAKHGWNKLDWFAKNYPSSIKPTVLIKSGFIAPKKGLLQ